MEVLNMLITKTSLISGITRTRNIAITNKELEAWQSGMLIQDAMPALSEAEREFVLTGITQDEWQQLCLDIDEIEEGP